MQRKGVSLAAGIFACCRPKWEALPVDADQRCVIRVEDMERGLNGTWVALPKEGHCTFPGPPVSNPGPEPYRKPGEARLSFGYFRRPFVVAGLGALKVPLIVGRDVYLVSNATLITSGGLADKRLYAHLAEARRSDEFKRPFPAVPRFSRRAGFARHLYRAPPLPPSADRLPQGFRQNPFL